MDTPGLTQFKYSKGSVCHSNGVDLV